MLFNSVAFLIFIALVIPVYFVLPQKGRPLFLLAASWYFYMSWNVAYLGLLIGFTALIYVLSALIERSKSQGLKKTFLILGLLLSFGSLFLFKYFDYTAQLSADLLTLLGIRVMPL